jgi:outer membrane protein assembly factor BamB
LQPVSPLPDVTPHYALVSYFYDREYYDNPAHAGELGEGIDIGKYVAGGIYVVDLQTLALKWHTHLDLSTDSVSFRAYIYSAPTLVDLDRDGHMEIVVGTSVGFLYVLRSDGSTMRGWPVQMGEIQGQVAAADLDGDGYSELIAADTRGSVAAFRRDGTELWERHLASLVAQGVTIGDIDGDGELEIAVGTSSGAIHVLKGATGFPVKPFPFYTQGRVMAPILLTRLHANNPALTLVAVSFDGFMYVIDGAAGCRDVIDIGETSYSMPLVDDLTGNGKMDIVLATMNGNVYAFESMDTEFDPLNAWTSQVHSVNNLVARGDWYGVRGTARGYHDVRGAHLDVPFEIVDRRKVHAGGKPHGPYAVTVTVTTPGFSRTVNRSFDAPGVYALKTEIPNWRARGHVTIRISDESKLFAEDSYGVSFHMRFYRVLKWILVVPFMLMTTALVQMTQEGNALPTFATQFRGGLEGGGAGGLGNSRKHV